MRQTEHGTGVFVVHVYVKVNSNVYSLVFSKINLIFFILYLLNSLKYPFTWKYLNYYMSRMVSFRDYRPMLLNPVSPEDPWRSFCFVLYLVDGTV